jgi:hypothetical protein
LPPGGFQEDEVEESVAATTATATKDNPFADIRASILALQQAQVKQDRDAAALRQAQDKQDRDAAASKKAIDSILVLLEQMNAKGSTQGKPLSDPDAPIPSIEQGTYKMKRTARVPDPEKLTDGVDPLFDDWSAQLRGKFQVNADHFANEAARIYYTYSCTSGDARRHLYPRYNPDAAEPFHTAEEMIRYLEKIYIDPYRVENARYEYERLRMKFGQSFHDFKTQFLHLADEARVPQSERFNHMYDRITTTLQDRLMILKYTLDGDFEKLCQVATGVDTDIKRTALRKKENLAARALSAVTGRTTTDYLSACGRSSTPAQPRLYTPVESKIEKRSATPEIKLEPKPLTCFKCGKMGHLSRDCYQQKATGDLKDIEDGEELEDADESGKEEA